MMILANMNLQARIERYKERGFQALEAEIIIVMEETAVALFKAFPDRFVLFGGASLLLFYDSPRLSRDLDLLLASPPNFPTAEEIQSAVRASIQPLAETLGLGQLEYRKHTDSPEFAKHWILANQKPLFSIDLTRIGGNVLEAQIVKKTIPSSPEGTVLTPSANYLLLQKCETFLNRRYVKARDAFDIHLLIHRGALLDKHLHAHLEDFITMTEMDRESIQDRIGNIDFKLCTVELRPVLPPAIFGELAEKEFEPICHSLRTVFSHWLQEQ
jgi:hypothetical protein